MHWYTNRDTLHIATPQLPVQVTVTKRNVASDLAQVYDVLGLFSPSTLISKVLIQKLWQLKIG